MASLEHYKEIAVKINWYKVFGAFWGGLVVTLLFLDNFFWHLPEAFYLGVIVLNLLMSLAAKPIFEDKTNEVLGASVVSMLIVAGLSFVVLYFWRDLFYASLLR